MTADPDVEDAAEHLMAGTVGVDAPPDDVPHDPNLPPVGEPPSAEGFYTADELRVGKRSGLLLKLYAKGFRKRFLAYRLINKAIWAEGGPEFSYTAREMLRRQHGVRVGAYTYGPVLRPYYTPSYVSVGRFCSIGPGLEFYRANHPIDTLSSHPLFYSAHLGVCPRTLVEWLPLEIGSDVWVGARVTALPGCRRIGHGSVIAAGAILTKDVPDFAVVAGVPAKPIKYRFPEPMREAILADPWWDKPLSQITEHIDAMQTPLHELGLEHPLINRRRADDTSGQAAAGDTT
jgi:acetyltransferase-like isoleucine patch superfamily enzyme